MPLTSATPVAAGPMRIELTRKADGTTTMRCMRADGSSTWQVQRAVKQASFFGLHDLMHYVVETELGCRSAFYGLIASGWDIVDTEGKGPRGPLPPEAVFVEHLVGAFDSERASPQRWRAAEFNRILDEASARIGCEREIRELTDGDIVRIQERWSSLADRWAALAPGEVLALPFNGDRQLSTNLLTDEESLRPHNGR